MDLFQAGRSTVLTLPPGVSTVLGLSTVIVLTYSSAALFIWDYIITLDKEVRYVWGRKPTFATILFMVNRYVNLSAVVFQLFSQATFQRPEVSFA